MFKYNIADKKHNFVSQHHKLPLDFQLNFSISDHCLILGIAGDPFK